MTDNPDDCVAARSTSDADKSRRTVKTVYRSVTLDFQIPDIVSHLKNTQCVEEAALPRWKRKFTEVDDSDEKVDSSSHPAFLIPRNRLVRSFKSFRHILDLKCKNILQPSGGLLVFHDDPLVRYLQKSTIPTKRKRAEVFDLDPPDEESERIPLDLSRRIPILNYEVGDGYRLFQIQKHVTIDFPVLVDESSAEGRESGTETVQEEGDSDECAAIGDIIRICGDGIEEEHSETNPRKDGLYSLVYQKVYHQEKNIVDNEKEEEDEEDETSQDANPDKCARTEGFLFDWKKRQRHIPSKMERVEGDGRDEQEIREGSQSREEGREQVEERAIEQLWKVNEEEMEEEDEENDDEGNSLEYEEEEDTDDSAESEVEDTSDSDDEKQKELRQLHPSQVFHFQRKGTEVLLPRCCLADVLSNGRWQCCKGAASPSRPFTPALVAAAHCNRAEVAWRFEASSQLLCRLHDRLLRRGGRYPLLRAEVAEKWSSTETKSRETDYTSQLDYSLQNIPFVTVPRKIRKKKVLRHTNKEEEEIGKTSLVHVSGRRRRMRRRLVTRALPTRRKETYDEEEMWQLFGRDMMSLGEAPTAEREEFETVADECEEEDFTETSPSLATASTDEELEAYLTDADRAGMLEADLMHPCFELQRVDSQRLRQEEEQMALLPSLLSSHEECHWLGEETEEEDDISNQESEDDQKDEWKAENESEEMEEAFVECAADCLWRDEESAEDMVGVEREDDSENDIMEEDTDQDMQYEEVERDDIRLAREEMLKGDALAAIQVDALDGEEMKRLQNELGEGEDEQAYLSTRQNSAFCGRTDEDVPAVLAALSRWANHIPSFEEFIADHLHTQSASRELRSVYDEMVQLQLRVREAMRAEVENESESGEEEKEEEEEVGLDNEAILEEEREETGLPALPAASLRRYRGVFDMPTAAGATRTSMLDGVERHFDRLVTDAAHTCAFFLHTVRQREGSGAEEWAREADDEEEFDDRECIL